MRNLEAILVTRIACIMSWHLDWTRLHFAFYAVIQRQAKYFIFEAKSRMLKMRINYTSFYCIVSLPTTW